MIFLTPFINVARSKWGNLVFGLRSPDKGCVVGKCEHIFSFISKTLSSVEMSVEIWDEWWWWRSADGTLSSVNFLPERLSPYCIISYNFAAAASATRPTFDQSLSPIGKYLAFDLQIRQDCGFLWHKCRNQTPLGEHSCFEGFGKTASSFSFASLLINIFVWTFSSVLL